MIKKARAEEAAVPISTRPAETARSSKKSDTSRRSDAPVSGTRIKKKTKALKPSKPKPAEQIQTVEEEPYESDSDNRLKILVKPVWRRAGEKTTTPKGDG